MSLEETSLILNRLAAALNTAHSRGIMHRDIKPANILLDEDGTVFLADFGLAAAIDNMERGAAPAAYGGSMFYMAPEQWQDEPLGQYTDVYQLGVTLFEMLTGERPFPDPNPQILLDRHVNSPVPNACEINPMLPTKIQPILEKTMAKMPKDRYATVTELAEDVANLLLPKQIKRRYEIKEELQHGRFAVVYQAQDLMNDQLVALKVMKEPLLTNQRFRREFEKQQRQIVNLPTHPTLMPVYDVDLHKGKPFIVMKFVEGASLMGRFRKERRLSVDQVCDIAHCLASGLDVLHEHGLVHGDINMGNVLIDSQQNCILTDFHMTAVAELTTSVLEQELPLAYLPALPPEGWAREPLVPQSDVYQLGLLLYELLTGQRPFAELSSAELHDGVANLLPLRVSEVVEDLPRQFDPIFMKALTKQPVERYASAGEFVQALRAAWQSHAFESYVYEGEKHHEAKEWDQAIEVYKKASALRPNNQAVSEALKRAERRKQDEVALEKCRQAIEKENWREAEIYLAQASETREKKLLKDLVQRKIQVELLYSQGKVALHQQDLLAAQTLLDQADALEPGYKDVNSLLGQLAEDIEKCFGQAREAMANNDDDRALALLKPVAEHETAVALRQEIVQKGKEPAVHAISNPVSLNWRPVAGAALIVVVAIVVILAINQVTGNQTPEDTVQPTINAAEAVETEETLPAVGEETAVPTTAPTPSVVDLENCLAEKNFQILLNGRRYSENESVFLPRELVDLEIELGGGECEIPGNRLRYRLVTVTEPDPPFQDAPILSYRPPADVLSDIALVNLKIEGGDYVRSIALNLNFEE